MESRNAETRISGRGSRGFTSLIHLVAILTVPIFCAPAVALDYSASAGASVTASRDTTGVVFLDVVGARRQSGVFTWQPVSSLGFIHARDVRADLDRHVIVAGTGFRLVDWWKQAYFGAQIGYASRTTAAVSSHGQFISTLGWQGNRYVIMLRHISNADLFGGKNLGETMALVGFTF